MLEERCVVAGSAVCVGLDSDYGLMPDAVKYRADAMPWRAITLFNRDIVEATADLVCAYKPNIAFYEGWGSQGLQALKDTVGFIKRPRA